MTDTGELKPCPFCGSTRIMGGTYYAEAEKVSRPAVRCADCTARAPLASWQCRVTFDDAQSAQVTDAMVEAGCRARHTPQGWGRRVNQPTMAAWVASHRDEMRMILTAALAALAAQPPAAPVETKDGNALIERLREQPSSFNDALRTMDEAASFITKVMWRARSHPGSSAATGDDLVERLRMKPKPHETIAVFVALCQEAAAEIEERDKQLNWAQGEIDRLLAQPQPLSVWHPIETAPKDGTPIEACNTRHPSHAPVIVRWDDDGLSDDVPEPHWCDAATRDGEALYYNQNYFDFWKPTTALPRPVSR